MAVGAGASCISGSRSPTSISGRDPVSDYETINRELQAYDARLATRPQIVVATKMDALDEPLRVESLKQRAALDRRPFYAISSATNQGVRELVNAISRALDELKDLPEPERDQLRAAS